MPDSAIHRKTPEGSAPGHAAGHSDDKGIMTAPLVQFDLQQEIANAEKQKPWPAGTHAKTLFKKRDFRAVLIVMEPGSKMSEHHADGTISVQVLKGKILFRVPDKTYDLNTGNLLMLDASIKHEVESQGEAAFLLTIGWPSS